MNVGVHQTWGDNGLAVIFDWGILWLFHQDGTKLPVFNGQIGLVNDLVIEHNLLSINIVFHTLLPFLSRRKDEW